MEISPPPLSNTIIMQYYAKTTLLFGVNCSFEVMVTPAQGRGLQMPALSGRRSRGEPVAFAVGGSVG
jgi:hypothetical protein